MWWNQFCTWVIQQCEGDLEEDQRMWKSLISNIPEDAQSLEKYQEFLVCWRASIAEDERFVDEFELAYKQKMLSIIDSALVYIANCQTAMNGSQWNMQ